MKRHHILRCLHPAIRGAPFFVVFFLLLCGICASFAAEQIPVKRVRILYGLNPNYPAHRLFTKGLQAVFGQSSDKFQVEYSFEYLDLGLGKADEKYRAFVADFLKRKYALKPRPDLVISHLTPANTFLVKYAKEIMPGVPVVFTGDQPGMIPLKDIPSNFAGIVREGNPAPAVSLILQAQPDTRKIYIVLGDSPHEMKSRLDFAKDLASFSDKVEIIYLNNLPFPQMMETIKGISGPSVILFINYIQDVAKNNFVPAKVSGVISQAANVPTYGGSAVYMGRGVVGGYQFSAEVVGERAAELGTKVLLGSRISDFPREQIAATAEYRFDWRALKRWKIDERRLPPESKFEYRTPTLWETHGWYVIGGFILLFVETCLIVGLLIYRKKRKRAEEALRERDIQFRKLSSSVPGMIYQFKKRPDGTYCVPFTTEAIRDIFGCSPEDVREDFSSINRVILPEDLSRLIDSIEASAERMTTWQCEYRAQIPGRPVRWLIGLSTPEKLADGSIVWHGFNADITERKQIEEQLQQTLESLRKAFGVTIQVMVSAVEARDPYTAGHQIRSADLARAIATEMALPQDKIEGIRMAGAIHDIGKLSIPAEILSKPTKLTGIEFSLIQEHSQSGYEMLKDVRSPWPLAEIVYQHHERMDGSGYPRKLKGDDILIEARILAVADVVEAMASHRPYRPTLGLPAALAEIENSKGLLFDADAVDACLRLFREKSFILKGA